MIFAGVHVVFGFNYMIHSMGVQYEVTKSGAKGISGVQKLCVNIWRYQSMQFQANHSAFCTCYLFAFVCVLLVCRQRRRHLQQVYVESSLRSLLLLQHLQVGAVGRDPIRVWFLQTLHKSHLNPKCLVLGHLQMLNPVHWLLETQVTKVGCYLVVFFFFDYI